MIPVWVIALLTVLGAVCLALPLHIGMTGVCLLLLAAVLLAAMTLTMTACGNSQEKTYEKATKLLNDGKYAEAAEKFESLGSYEDASQMTMYAKAIYLPSSGAVR